MSDRSESALDKLRRAGAGRIGQELLGCSWGRSVSTPDDLDPCPEQAITIHIVHDEQDREHPLKLCAHHGERLLRETVPRVDQNEASQ